MRQYLGMTVIAVAAALLGALGAVWLRDARGTTAQPQAEAQLTATAQPEALETPTATAPPTATAQPTPSAQPNVVTADTVITRDFRVVDAEGRVRLRARVLGNNEVSLSLLDPQEQVRLLFSVRQDGVAIGNWRDANGTDRIYIDTGEGLPSITLADGRGKSRIYLGLGNEERPRLTLNDDREQRRVYIGETAPLGTPQIQLLDAGGGITFQTP